MAGYTKVFESILRSTVWTQTPHYVRSVWTAMMVLADKDGIVESSIPGLAHAAVATIKETEEALDYFLSPDPYSRTKEHEGRRIEEIDGGWRLLNKNKYRDKLSEGDKREYERNRKRRWREENGDVPNVPECPGHVPDVPNVPDMSPMSRNTESDTDTDTKKKKKEQKEKPAYSASFLSFWGAYPEKKGKLGAWKAWQKAVKRADPKVIISAIEKHKRSSQWQAGYIKHPATWLNQGCWEDEVASQSTNSPTIPFGTNTGQTSTTARLSKLEHKIVGDIEVDPGQLRDLSAVVSADGLNYPRKVYDWLKACERSGALEMDGLKVEPFWGEPTRPSTLKNWQPQRGQVDDLIERFEG